MSQRALCLAVRDRIRTALSLDSTTCKFTPDGMPPPIAGELYVAVHPGPWRGIDIEGLAEVVGVSITVTRRIGEAPYDRQGEEVWAKATEGMEETLRAILAAIHLDNASWATMAAANAYISGTVNKFVEPLRFVDGGRPEPKGPEWFSADDYEGRGRFANAGLAQTMRFDGAKRYQTIESMA